MLITFSEWSPIFPPSLKVIGPGINEFLAFKQANKHTNKQTHTQTDVLLYIIDFILILHIHVIVTKVRIMINLANSGFIQVYHDAILGLFRTLFQYILGLR